MHSNLILNHTNKDYKKIVFKRITINYNDFINYIAFEDIAWQEEIFKLKFITV